MALKLELSPGDVIRIGSGTVLRVEFKTGSRTRVSIESEYRVQREPRAITAPSRGGQSDPPRGPLKRPAES